MLREKCWQAELELVRLALSSPVQAVPLIRKYGVGCEHFSQDDTSMLWAAATLCEERSELEVLDVAEIGLRHLGLWDERQIAGNLGSMRWSLASLAAFILPGYFVASLLCHAAGKLLDLCRREAEARACWQRAIDLIEFHADPERAAKAIPAKPRFVLTHSRKRGAA